MNLHELAPTYFPDEQFDPELEKIYKQCSANSHLTALETIFEMGAQEAIKYIELNMEVMEAGHQLALDSLGKRLDELAEKHENLKAQIAASAAQDSGHPGNDAIVQREAVAQVMGMGGTFAK